MDERRQFGRLELSEDVRVRDTAGRDFGRVQQVGGGGMTIAIDSLAVAEEFSAGKRLRVTVIEPNNVDSLTLDILVRYREARLIGVEFLSHQEQEASV